MSIAGPARLPACRSRSSAVARERWTDGSGRPSMNLIQPNVVFPSDGSDRRVSIVPDREVPGVRRVARRDATTVECHARRSPDRFRLGADLPDERFTDLGQRDDVDWNRSDHSPAGRCRFSSRLDPLVGRAGTKQEERKIPSDEQRQNSSPAKTERRL